MTRDMVTVIFFMRTEIDIMGTGKMTSKVVRGIFSTRKPETITTVNFIMISSMGMGNSLINRIRSRLQENSKTIRWKENLK